MKKENWALGLSCTAVVISIAAICFCCFRCEPFEKDWMSILVSILSVLVTVLIGWQIINLIGINKKLKEYERASNKSAKEEIEKYSHSVRSYVFSLMTLDLYRRNITEYAIDNFIKAIDEGLKGTDKDAIEIAISHLELIISKNGRFITILNGKRKEYISILSKVNDERIDAIIETLIKAEESSSFKVTEDEVKEEPT